MTLRRVAPFRAQHSMLHHECLKADLDFSVEESETPSATRVALVTGSYHTRLDGVALTLNRLARTALLANHSVLVLAPSDAKAAPVLTHAARLHRVPSVPLPLWSEYRLTWGMGRAAAAVLAAFRPTVVHVAVPDALGHAAVRWARRERTPVICSHHTRWSAYLGYYRLGIMERPLWWALSRFLQRCDVTLAPSAATLHELEAHGVPRLALWPRGVDRCLFHPSRASSAWRADIARATAHTPVLLLVCRLRWEKGLDTFARTVLALRGMDALPFHTVVVGEGPARADLQRRLPFATFTGSLSGAALATAYASSDVFLYPSTTEGWGATCLEAQASGLPIVATASSGVTDVVAHGSSGFLVAPSNVSALAAAAATLLGNPSLRATMGAHAVAHAANFSWSASGEGVLSWYRRLAV